MINLKVTSFSRNTRCTPFLPFLKRYTKGLLPLLFFFAFCPPGNLEYRFLSPLRGFIAVRNCSLFLSPNSMHNWAHIRFLNVSHQFLKANLLLSVQVVKLVVNPPCLQKLFVGRIEAFFSCWCFRRIRVLLAPPTKNPSSYCLHVMCQDMVVPLVEFLANQCQVSNSRDSFGEF